MGVKQDQRKSLYGRDMGERSGDGDGLDLCDMKDEFVTEYILGKGKDAPARLGSRATT